jgi:hypothetical protein
VIATQPPDPLVRHRLVLATPAAWPVWPFLPVVRRRDGADEELGVLFDAVRAVGLTGFSATVFRTNIFTLPPTLAGLLALPREVYDTADELVAAGWRVD